jgi:undecaprenyl-diphosphatase
MQALALGVLQGATEFLPISSSGHLVLAQNLIPGLSGPLLLFDVVVHLGTLVAIVVLLRVRIARLVLAAASLLPAGWGGPAREGLEVERQWIFLLAAGTLPTAIVGFGLRGLAEELLHRPAAVGLALLVTAALLVGSERFGRRTRQAGELGWIDAVAIGTAQGLAVIPGISRSGATVAVGLWRDARGDVAVEFSLLLSVPAVAGAALLVGLESAGELRAEHLAPLATGFVAALVTGMAALKALQWVVVKRRLFPFALYCAVVGIGAIALG